MNEQTEQAKALLTKEALSGDHPDYDQLHQGVDGTALRHKAVMELMTSNYGGVPPVLVDFGCGTALLLKSLAEGKYGLPERYVGVDRDWETP